MQAVQPGRRHQGVQVVGHLSAGVGAGRLAGPPHAPVVKADHAQAPWIFSPGFYQRFPDRVAALIAEAAEGTQPAATFAAQMAALVDHDARDRLAELTAPTLVIAAEDDIIIRPGLSRRLFEAVTGAQWRVVPGGHAAFWEDPGPWNRAVIEFVQAHS